MVKSRNWVEVDPYKDEDGEVKTHDYKIEEKEEQISQTIYNQEKEEKLDLMAVINAFNK